MIAHEMPLVAHPLHQLRIALHEVVEDEERAVDLLGFQRVEALEPPLVAVYQPLNV